MAEKRDYYEVLGLKKGSSDDEIKKAYRRMAKENHPDLNPGDKAAETRFKEISEAYEVLSDEGKRSRYDQFGHAGVDPSAGGYGGSYSGDGYGGFGGEVDLGSIFESFFGGSFGGSRRNAPRKGDTIRSSLSLTFEEAAFGCEKEITLNRIESCEDCRGSGAAEGTTPDTCTACKGTGQVRVTQRTPLGSFQSTGVCKNCGGMGKIIKNPCQKCRGTGQLRRKVAISVRVPAGIDDNQTVSLRGQGNAGSMGGPPGDVLVTIQVRRHPVFERDGTSIHLELPVTFVQAALGAEIEVPTIDGNVKLTVPEGTQSGAVLRLKGKGIVPIGSRNRGDQFVHVFVEVPRNLEKNQKELLRAFGESLNEKQHTKRKGFFDKFR